MKKNMKRNVSETLIELGLEFDESFINKEGVLNMRCSKLYQDMEFNHQIDEIFGGRNELQKDYERFLLEGNHNCEEMIDVEITQILNLSLRCGRIYECDYNYLG